MVQLGQCGNLREASSVFLTKATSMLLLDNHGEVDYMK
jgi:hypothetical protein